MACNTDIYEFLINHCVKTPPGVNRVLATRREWVSAYPAKDAYPGVGEPNTISGDITLDTVGFPTAVWVEWQGTKEKMGFISETTGDFGSSTYSSRLELFLPGNDPLLSFVMDESLDDDLIILYQYSNLKWRFLGDLNFPAHIRFDQASGKARGDEVGYNLTIEVPIHSEPFGYYTGTIPI